MQRENFCIRKSAVDINRATANCGRFCFAELDVFGLTSWKIPLDFSRGLCYNIDTIKKGDNQMKHYLFVDDQNDEEFLVGAANKDEAFDIACSYFEECHLVCEVSEFEAENSGLDEY